MTALELPVVPYFASLLYAVMGFNVYAVRLPSLLAFLLLIFFIFKLVKRESGVVLALLSAFFVGIFPLGNPYRNFLFSEPAMLFFSVFSIYQYAQWMDFRKKSNLILFIIGFSLAISLKPTSLYLGLPLLWVHFRKYRFELKKYWAFIWPVALSLIIPVLWYSYAYYISKNHIDVFGVFGGQFGGHNKFQTFAMLSDFTWYTRMYARMKWMLLGNAGLLIMAVGILTSLYYKKGLVFFAYLLAIGSFFVIVAEGNIDTVYRQLTIIPSAAFFMALGTVSVSLFVYNLMLKLGAPSNTFVKVLAAGFCIALLAISPIKNQEWYASGDVTSPVHETEWILAQEIKKLTPDASRIIMAGSYTIHKGGNDLCPVIYHYSDLQGWSIQKGEWNEAVIDELKAKGASLFGAMYFKREAELEKFLDIMSEKYKVLYSNPEKQLLLLSLSN